MAEILKAKRRGSAVDLPDDIYSEILLRLPAKSVLRFRAVCKTFFCLLSDPSFLLSHHKHQPSAILLFSYKSALDTFHLRTGRRQQLLHDCIMHCFSPKLVASCDGLLLFHLKCLPGDISVYCIHNPTTMQWADLPSPPPSHHLVSAFYFHPPSREFRALSVRYDNLTSKGILEFCILATGAAKPRSISWLASIGESRCYLPVSPPVMLRNCLHWDPWMADRITVFDTMSEEFRQLQAPWCSGMIRSCVLAIEGALGLSITKSEMTIDLWVLGDYKKELWSCKYRIDISIPGRPLYEQMCFAALLATDEGDLLLECDSELAIFDLRTKTFSKIAEFNDFSITRHLFKESLVVHEFFETQPSLACEQCLWNSSC